MLRQEAIDDNDYLVVISHPCDITIPPDTEPYVEVMRAYWTNDRSSIYGAGKTTPSAASFFVVTPTIMAN